MRIKKVTIIIIAIIHILIVSVSFAEEYGILTYNANGGILGNVPKMQSIILGMENEIFLNVPSRNKYSFSGWSKSLSASEADYLPGDTIIENSSLTLYAVWEEAKPLGSIEEIEYSVDSIIEDAEQYYCFTARKTGSYKITIPSFNESFGSLYFDAEAEEWRQTYCTVTVALEKYSKDGDGNEYISKREACVFKSDGGKQQEIIMDLNKDETYYLSIVVDDYEIINEYGIMPEICIDSSFNRIVFNANGGDLFNVPKMQSVLIGENNQLTTKAPRKSNHTFVGWSTLPTASEAEYRPGDNIIPTDNTTLYAVWEDAQTIENELSKIRVENEIKDAEKCYLISPQTTSEYRFTLEQIGGDSNYYAIILNVHNYRKDSNGQEHSGIDSVQVFYSDHEERQELIMELEAGNQYCLSIVYDEFTDGFPVFNLKIESDYLRINYDPNGGDLFNVPTSQSIEEGVETKLSTNSPTREKYSFLGWSFSSDEKDIEYVPGMSIQTNQTMTLYAVWQEAEKVDMLDDEVTFKYEPRIKNSEKYYYFLTEVPGVYRFTIQPEGLFSSDYYAIMSIKEYRSYNGGMEYPHYLADAYFDEYEAAENELVVKLEANRQYYLSVLYDDYEEQNIDEEAAFSISISAPINENAVLMLPKI